MGKGSIIIVDDEPGLVRLLSRMLSQTGWETHSCKTSEQAVREAEIIDSGNGSLRCILIDLGIINQNGFSETGKVLKSNNPELKLVVMSGDTCNPVMVYPENSGFDASLPKPFTYIELVSLFDRLFRHTIAGDL